MNRKNAGRSRFCCAVAVLAAVWSSVDAAPGELAIVNVDVIPMDSNRVLQDQTVVIADGSIRSVAATAAMPIPDGATIIDGDGLYLAPGLADMHTHIRNEGELGNYLAWGITTIMHLGGSGLDPATVRQFRDEVRTGSRTAPNIYTTDRILDGNPALPSHALSLVDPERAKQEVRRLRQDGYDFVKIYNNVSQPVFDAIVAEAGVQGLAVIGHIPRGFDSRESLGGGQDAVAHTEEFFFTYFGGPRSTEDMPKDYAADRGRIPELTRLLVDNDVAVMPDLSFEFTSMLMWDDLDLVWQDPEMAFVHPSTVSMWEGGNLNRRDNLENFMLRGRWKYALMHELTYAFQQAGVLQVIGTDSSLPGLFPGKAAHRELTELTKAGLTNFEALAVGSRNAGEFVRRYIDADARIGLVQPGYRADLVLFRENPLDDIRHARSVEAVIVNGYLHDRRKLDAARADLAARYEFLAGLNERVDEALPGDGAGKRIRRLADRYRKDDEAVATIESRVNAAGYAAAYADDLDLARRLFELNTTVFPNSANAWDSLAEVTLYQGDREQALELYRRALEADPEFANAAEKIRQLASPPANP